MMKSVVGGAVIVVVAVVAGDHAKAAHPLS
jgi:hypothetical protein